MSTVATKNDVLQLMEQHRDKIRGLGVRRIGVFGSFSHDAPAADSDVDVLVDFETKTFDAYMDLMFFLEDLFGRKVDLVIEDAVKPRLKPYIMSNAIYAEGF